jgi:hypothetical protein
MTFFCCYEGRQTMAMVRILSRRRIPHFSHHRQTDTVLKNQSESIDWFTALILSSPASFYESLPTLCVKIKSTFNVSLPDILSSEEGIPDHV